MARFDGGRPAVETPGGVVTAGRAIVALNAWARDLREFRRSLFVRGTYIVMTAPAPERLEAIGWTGGEGVYDLRTSLHYLRTTRDGRIAFGGSSFRVTGGQADAPRYGFNDERRFGARRATSAAGSQRSTTSRSRPRGAVRSTWPACTSPFFGTLPGGVTHYGLGFTGNGVGPCHLGGKILSGLALGLEDEATTLPISDGDRLRFPPEPLLTLGERLISRTIVRRDDRLDAGRAPGRATELLARLPRRLGYNLGP